MDIHERLEEMRKSSDKAELIVAAILDDINDRKGFEFDGIDEETQNEIVDSNIERVRAILDAEG